MSNLTVLTNNNIKSIDITVLGGCSLDQIFYQNQDGSWNDKADIYSAGGKGSNQAVAASRAGASVRIISRLKNDSIGSVILDNLKLNGIDTSCVELVDDIENDTTKIYINKDDRDNEMHRQDDAINSFTPDMIDKYKDQLLSSKLVLAQTKVKKELVIRLIDFCHKYSIPIIITPSKPKKLSITDDYKTKELIDKINYITCNKEECQILFGTDNIEECVTNYPNKLIVTLGRNGVIYHDGNKIIKIPAIKGVKVVDTVGAGDTFCGNFAASLINGCELKEAIYRAQIAAEIKIGQKSAQDGMPYKEQLDEYIKAYERGISFEKINVSKRKSFIFDKKIIDKKI